MIRIKWFQRCLSISNKHYNVNHSAQSSIIYSGWSLDISSQIQSPWDLRKREIKGTQGVEG